MWKIDICEKTGEACFINRKNYKNGVVLTTQRVCVELRAEIRMGVFERNL
jgi:hypothetical protein